MRVVFVCTGNRFRSPLAEASFRAASADLPIQVESFGTLDLGPVPALPEAVREARALGLDLVAHRARPASGSDLSTAALVVGFERMHLATAVVDAAAPRDRVFTLPELVEVLGHVAGAAEGDPLVRARRLLTAAARGRPIRPADWHPPEIVDPLGAPATEQRGVARRVDELTRRLAATLFGRPPG